MKRNKKVLFFIIILNVCILIAGCKKEAIQETSIDIFREQDKEMIDSVRAEIHELQEKVEGIETQPESVHDMVDEQYETIIGGAEDLRNFSDGLAWVRLNGAWTCINTEGEILFALDYIYEPETDFINGFAIIQDQTLKGEKGITGNILIDKDGESVLDEWTDENNAQILQIGENDGCIDIWTYVVEEDYQSFKAYFKVINKFKGRNETGELNYNQIVHFDLPTSNLDYKENYGISSLGEGLYRYTYWGAQYNGVYVYNTNEYSQDSNSDSKGLSFYVNYCDDNLGYNDGIIRGSGGLVDSAGNEVLHIYDPKSVKNTTACGYFSEGLFSIASRENYRYVCEGFYDINGNKVIDLSGYTTSSLPFYKNGYCVLTFKNDGNIDYFTILDKEGTQLFEPQRGKVMGDDLSSLAYVKDGIIIVLDGEGTDEQRYRYVDTSGNDVLEEYQYYADNNGNGILNRFYSGIARIAVERDGRRGYVFINREGEELKYKVPELENTELITVNLGD